MRWAAQEDWTATTAELNRLDLDKDAIAKLVGRAILHRRYRGVYVVGGGAGPRTELRAASKAVPRGAIGGTGAVFLDGFGPHPARPYDVVVPPHAKGRRRGLRLHRIALGPADVVRRGAIPATTAEIAVLHLAGSMSQRDYEMLLQEAFAKRRTNAQKLAGVVARHGGRPGVPLLRRMLEIGVDDLRSRAEHALRRAVVAGGFPRPEYNAKVGRWRVDALWRQQAVALEINGFWAHASPWAQNRDHVKEQELRAAGLEPLRYTALQAIDESARLVAGLAVALARPR